MKHLGVHTRRNGSTVPLVSMAIFLGLLISYPVDASPAARASARDGDDSAHASIKQERQRRHLGKSKIKHERRHDAGHSKAQKRSTLANKAQDQGNVDCGEAFDRGKETARQLQLRAARQSFASCARKICGHSLQNACAGLVGEIDAVLPSIVPVVDDDTASASAPIEVRMDGELLTSRLDGAALVVDPGDHEFAFARQGEVFARRTLAIERGQRNRIVAVSFGSQKPKSGHQSPAAAEEQPMFEGPQTGPTTDSEEGGFAEDQTPGVVRRGMSRNAPATPERSTGTPWSAYAWAGVGVLGVGGYGFLTFKGRQQNDVLIEMCKPDCKPASVRNVKKIYLVADLSLGVGVAALAVSSYLFLRSDPNNREEGRGRRRVTSMTVEPISSGALASLGGTF